MKTRRDFYIKAGIIAIVTLACIMPGSAVLTKTIDFEYDYIQAKTTLGITNRDIVFQDSFETYPDFIVDDFPPWTTYDGDGGQTWGMQGVTWPNAGYVGAFMIFNPSQTSPPINTNHPAHTGQKYASCWDAVTQYAPNNDWLITPKLLATTFETVSFWARSITTQYGLERFKVLVSTTDTNPSSFVKISPGAYVETPVTWTQYTYDISQYSGQQIYIAINVVSNDAFAFFLDDFVVTGTGGVQPLQVDAGGPYTADVGVPIQFTGTATGGVAPYTWLWNFGNGATSTAQNPTYAYPEPGTYTVTLTVTDSANPQNQANDTAAATITCPLEITAIKGGFGITVTAKNTGSADLTNVAWRIVLNGGVIILGKEKTGTIDIPAGDQVSIKSFVLGFGKTTVTTTVGCAEKEVDAKVLLFLVKI
ncbi:MAG: choice-of-anchor J domain-containing protein [Candidatus Thermoplasmatota archaeon]